MTAPTAAQALAALAARLQSRIDDFGTDADDYDRDDMPVTAAGLRGETAGLHTALDEIATLSADLAAETPGPVEVGAEDQATALAEHLCDAHHTAPADLDDIRVDLAALAASHGADHAGRHVYSAIGHDRDDHQHLQDRAAELARQRADTAEVTS